jgi:iron complex outermembrane receptor protein
VKGAARGSQATAVFLLLFCWPALAAPQDTPSDLTALSLESLLDMEVTSVSRREQKVSQSASAIYVITREDIRRSGVTTIPDALRMAPGVTVMQMDGSKWAISIRGFTGRFSNKLLEMIDGRSIYSPTFGGVYWEANDELLEDIERIEDIRGPGATLWGSNAVNGVINIITKDTQESQGVLVSSGGGNQEGGFAAARFGGKAGSRLHYRLDSKYNSRSGLLLPSGDRANDNLWKMQGGFRLDWDPSERDEVLFSGDAYEGGAGERFRVPLRESPFQQETSRRTSFSGANLLGRWTHKHSERSLTQSGSPDRRHRGGRGDVP